MSSPGTRLLANTFPPVQQGLDRALAFAVKAGNVRQVKWLLSRGADINARAEDGTTALHLAAAAPPERSERVLDAFAGQPLHWNQTGKAGITPFAVLVSTRLGANRNQFAARCERALEEGADANVGNAGYPLLGLAAEQMNPRFVRLLLAHGARVEGDGAYAKLKYESGTHRVQRVPATESQGRIHTSAATVAIIALEVGGEVDIAINPADLKVDTFRSSGAGGQHVNKTESAIRITHVPSGVVVESQTERSQHANRDKAMKRLQAMLVEAEIEKRAAATAADRKLQVGSGDRSQRIRTYNYPQGRITDHRVEGLTLYDLPNILEGELDALVGRLQQERQAEELARLAQEA